MDDLELLNAYADHRDQGAFTQLVRRHGTWLYAAARRQLADGHLAEDATQAVFLLLSQRGGSLRRYRYLSGWLFLALSYCIRDIKHQRSRRERQEQEAAAMRPETIEPEAKWDEIAPVLEEAMGSLGRQDREAVLLRFYEQKPLAEVGRVLGVSEEAAQKRVERAVGKLREQLAAKGVETEAASLAGVVLAYAAEGGVAGMVEKVMAGIADGVGHGTAGVIANGAGKMMVMAKVKVAAAILAGIMVTAGGAAVVARAGSQVEQRPAPVAAADPLPAPVGELARPTWPAGGDLQLVQISVVVDAKVVEKLRTLGQAIPTQSNGYEAMRVDPELVLHYLRMARKADLAYLPVDMWSVWSSPVLLEGMRTQFVFENRWTSWRGEQSKIGIMQRLGTPTVHEQQIAGGELRVDLPNMEIRMNGVTQTRDIRLRTKVAAGDGMVLMGKIGQMRAGEVWHLLLYQVISATPEELSNYREMRDVVSWIEGGTAAEQQLVQQAVRWQERAKGTEPGQRWTKDLPGGARVELLGIANPELNPYCWWTGDGRPALPGYRRTPAALPSDRKDGTIASAWVSVSHPDGWFARKRDESWYNVRQDRTIEVVTGSGPFKTVAALKPELGARTAVEGHAFAVKQASSAGESCSLLMDYTLFVDRDVQIAAIDAEGKMYPQQRMGVRAGDRTVTIPDANVWFPVSLAKVNELRVQTRPLYRVKFANIAVEAVEEMPVLGEAREVAPEPKAK